MCYTAPLIGAVVTTAAWAKTRSAKVWWLFGVIDHWWNGELFLISENIISDLLLGVAITAVILISWGITVVCSKTNPTLANYVNTKQ